MSISQVFAGIASRARFAMILSALLIVAGCNVSVSDASDEVSHSEDRPTLYVSGIPDQDTATLNRQHELIAEYLSAETGLDVEYVSMVDYAALVTAFERGDIHLAWFGALTGVQARSVTEGSEAIVHRPRDAEFHSEFIVQADLDVESLEDLRGLSFTFGSESSTSGHLMPRYFLTEAGIDPDEDFNGLPNYSGSHDATIELVQSGAYQAGALNEGVWESWVEDGRADPDRVRVFYTTPPYFNYNWSILGDIDDDFGEGTRDAIIDAFLSMGPEQQEILDLFHAEGFVETENANYESIEDVARELGLIR